MSDEDDMDDEISPWEAAQREEEDVKHVYHHVRSGPLFFIALVMGVAIGVFCGLCLFNRLCSPVGL